MAGAKTASKNSRPSSSAPKHAQTLGDTRLIIPCNAGKNAYVRDVVSGKNPNLATASDAFVEALRVNAAAGHGDKLRGELERLTREYPAHGWQDTLARVEQAGALAA